MGRRHANADIQQVFRNDRAVALWLFMAVWLGMTLLMTGVALRDAGIPGTGLWGWAVLALFWLFGVGAAGWAATHARLRIRLHADGIEVSERYPFRSTSRRYRSRELSLPRLETRRDSDGDALHVCLLDLPGRAPLTVSEGPDAATVAAVQARLATSLNRVCRLNGLH